MNRVITMVALGLLVVLGQLACQPPKEKRNESSGLDLPDKFTAGKSLKVALGLVHVHDMQAELGVEFPIAKLRAVRDGTRSVLGTALLREGVPIGAILIRRTEVRPFTEKQIALLKTFADQSVIAIENVRLFRELDERTNELTRSVGEIKALGEVSRAVSSTLNLETVLTRIVSHAVQLTGVAGGAI